MSGSELFDPLFGPAVSDAELVAAMLAVEAALARAGARSGVIPSDHAESIAGCCVADRFDIAALGAATRLAGNPVIPLVQALTAAVPEAARGSVHVGGTSQDILDTALMLVAAERRRRIDAALQRAGDACEALADSHRATVMAGRTLFQHALPITFGVKAARWLAGLTGTRRRLRGCVLPLQFGGAAGTLASLGSAGPAMSASISEALGLEDPVLPWHTDAAPIADLGAALAMVCGSLAKIAIDVELLMQTEVAEAFEPSGPGRGGSSTLPHKRNPVATVAIRAAHQQSSASAGGLIAGMATEHERAAGNWHASWEPLLNLLRLTEGAAVHGAELLEGLELDPARMALNVEITGGRIVAEAVVTALRPSMGRAAAEAIVKQAAALAGPLSANLPAAVAGDPAVVAALDPSNYLGANDHFIDRAIAAWRGL